MLIPKMQLETFMRKAFTLIELLIVVAIIAILAAIAVPNFLEAQVRAKVSRCKADQRSLATAIESYVVDNNKYPPPYVGLSGQALNGPSVFDPGRLPNAISGRFIRLTTPIAYITSVFPETFVVQSLAAGSVIVGDLATGYDTYDYFTDAFGNPTRGRALSGNCAWRVAGVGPDRKACFGGRELSRGAADEANAGGCAYDPTNGTVSAGDIVRSGPPSQLGGDAFYARDRDPLI